MKVSAEFKLWLDKEGFTEEEWAIVLHASQKDLYGVIEKVAYRAYRLGRKRVLAEQKKKREDQKKVFNMFKRRDR